MTNELQNVALALVADGKGILAADETSHSWRGVPMQGSTSPGGPSRGLS